MLLGLIALLSATAAVVICVGSGAFSGLGWLWVLPVSFCGSYLALMLLAFLFLWLMCALVDQRKVPERDSKFYRGMTHLYVDALIRIAGVRIHTEGLENTPKDGRFLLVCNHLFAADPGVLLACFRNSQLAFITKKENCSMFIVGPMMHKILCQPLDRENDRQALNTILRCIDLIRQDQVSIGVFPEGYTSKDGHLHPFRSGVFKIAQKAKVPIVVCTLRNTRAILHNALRLKKTDVRLHLVGVIGPEKFQGQTAVQISDRVHRMMAQDLGQSE